MGKGYAESGKRQSSGCISERGKTVYSYQEFFEKADEFARILFYRYQVEPGMRIGLLMHNDMEFLISACALSRLRAAIVLCPAECGREEAVSLIRREKLQGLIFHKDFIQWFPIETEECFLVCTGRSGIARLTGGSLLPELPV